MTASVTGRIASSNTVDIPSCVLLVKKDTRLSMWETCLLNTAVASQVRCALVVSRIQNWELPTSSGSINIDAQSHAGMLGWQTWLRCC